jgi:branched-chain amino acid transport system substrate-binding protein
MNLRVSRRTLLQGVAAVGLGSAIARPAIAIPKTLKIGVVAPRTGPLAFFSENLDFVIGQIQRQFGGQLDVNGMRHPLEIIVKDSQSNPNRASEVAAELILQGRVNVMTSFGTPETTNPVSDQCDLNGVPSVSTNTPLESWFFGRNGNPKEGFEWSYNFFFDVPNLIGTYLGIWDRVPGNKKSIGLLLANDSDGNAFASLMPGMLKKAGYKVIDPGRFDLPASNYNAQISAFKSAGVDGVFMSLPSPEFAAFWNESAQQGLRPLFVTPGKGGELPPAVIPFGRRAENLSIEVWWDQTYPFNSSITKQSSSEYAAEYEAKSQRQASMALGHTHALFEIAIGTLKNTRTLDKPASVRVALRDTKHSTIVGDVDFKSGPLPNSANTPLVGGQWRRGKKWPLEVAIVDNSMSPQVPVNGEVKAISYE